MLQPPVQPVSAAAPAPGPIGILESDADSVTLGVPELGSVRIDVAGIQVLAPDEGAIDATWVRLGTWATAQWLQAQGLRVVRGSAVARDGRALIVIGETRIGASVTCAQLTRHGWGIVSDGIVALDASGRVMATEPRVRLDTIVAEKLFADAPRTAVAAGWPRSDVTLPGHGDASVIGYVGLIVREASPGLNVAVADIDTPPAGILVPTRIPCPVLPEPPAGERSFVVTRPAPRTMEMLAQVGPPQVALGVLAALAELESAVVS